MFALDSVWFVGVGPSSVSNETLLSLVLWVVVCCCCGGVAIMGVSVVVPICVVVKFGGASSGVDDAGVGGGVAGVVLFKALSSC